MNKLIGFLADKLTELLEKRGRMHIIYGGNNNDPYLIRYILLKSKLCSIYFHRFLVSDSDVPHDHPWPFITYVIRGSYTEHFYDTEKPNKTKTKFKEFWTKRINKRKQGSIALRMPTNIHRVVVAKKRTLEDMHKAPFTVCIIGPRIRNWGFWETSDTFVDWRRYLNIKPNDPRIEGSE